MLARWEVLDPSGAMEYAQSTGTKQQQEQRVTQAMWSWAQSDPAAAAAALASGRYPVHEHVRGQLASISAQQDPDAALAWAREQPSKSTMMHGMGSILGQVVNTIAQTDRTRVAKTRFHRTRDDGTDLR